MRPGLSDEQIRRTLARHGFPEDTELLGITYTDQAVTLTVRGHRLIVPDDVLELRPQTAASGSLFPRTEE